MKFKLRVIAALALITLSSSCSFFNSNTVEVAINSTPSGADVFIEGKNYGRTPLVMNIQPKPYNAVVVKEGYGSTNLNMDIWYGTIRTNVDGEKTADGSRCLLDMMTLIFSFNAWNAERCGDFKQKTYEVIIPRSASFGKNSAMGVGQSRQDMIPYYYQ